MPDSSEEPKGSSHHRVKASAAGQALSIVAVVVAVGAIGLTALLTRYPDTLRNLAAPGPSYTDAQRAEAKVKTCNAFNTVRAGVSLNTNRANPGGEADVVGSMVVAANSRVSLYDGGQYLDARIDPATPPELADSMHAFADVLVDIGAAATAGVPNTDPGQTARLQDADKLNGELVNACK